jgi:hypothetical protein
MAALPNKKLPSIATHSYSSRYGLLLEAMLRRPAGEITIR